MPTTILLAISTSASLLPPRGSLQPLTSPPADDPLAPHWRLAPRTYVARRLPRMRGHWSRDNFRLLGRLLGHPDAAALLAGRHELRAAQVLVVGAALGAGLLDRVTPTLLHDVTAPFGGRWHRGCLDAAFAQLACHALTHPIPKLRSAAHLARLLKCVALDLEQRCPLS